MVSAGPLSYAQLSLKRSCFDLQSLYSATPRQTFIDQVPRAPATGTCNLCSLPQGLSTAYAICADGQGCLSFAAHSTNIFRAVLTQQQALVKARYSGRGHPLNLPKHKVYFLIEAYHEENLNTTGTCAEKTTKRCKMARRNDGIHLLNTQSKLRHSHRATCKHVQSCPTTTPWHLLTDHCHYICRCLLLLCHLQHSAEWWLDCPHECVRGTGILVMQPDNHFRCCTSAICRW